MRNCLVVMCLLVLCITFSAAQEKISSQWKCDEKPADEHSIDVPDHVGHTYGIAQGKCTAEKGSMGDAKDQESTYTEFDDATSSGLQNHGVLVVTLSSGDKVFYHYHGTQSWKDGGSGNNKWSLAGGTGKFKSVKGQGGCKGTGRPQGYWTWNCEGKYSAGK